MRTRHSWHARMGTLNTCTQTLEHTRTHKHAHRYTHKRTHACTHTHTQTHACMHACTHTHTYTPHSHTIPPCKTSQCMSCRQDHMVTLLPTTLHLHVLYVYTSNPVHLGKLQTSTWMFRAVGPHQGSGAQQNTYQTTQFHYIHRHPLPLDHPTSYHWVA